MLLILLKSTLFLSHIVVVCLDRSESCGEAEIALIGRLTLVFSSSRACCPLLLQILQPREHLLYERHPAVPLQPALVLQRPAEAGHPVEEGPRQRPPQVWLGLSPLN